MGPGYGPERSDGDGDERQTKRGNQPRLLLTRFRVESARLDPIFVVRPRVGVRHQQRLAWGFDIAGNNTASRRATSRLEQTRSFKRRVAPCAAGLSCDGV